MSPIGLTHVDSHALRALDEVPCGSGCWSSGYFPNTVEFIPHQRKGCLDEGWVGVPPFHSGVTYTELLSIWKCFYITLSRALRDMWVSSPVGAADMKIFSIIA
jgi:hypothetical protein